MKQLLNIWALTLFILISFSSYAEPMKFAYFDQYTPRSYIENGQMKGILIDIINLIVRDEMGVEVSHKGYPWRRTQAMVKSGQADAYIAVPTPERREYAIVSKEPVITFQSFLATTKDNPRFEELQKITSLEQLKNYRLADYFGNGWAKNTLKGMNIMWLPDYEAIYSFIKEGRADAFITSKKSAQSKQRRDLSDKFHVFSNPLATADFHLCINKNSEYANIIDRFDTILSEKKKQGIIDKLIESYY